MMDFLFRCFYNLASKQQSPYLRLVTAHGGLWLWLHFAIVGLYLVLLQQVGPAYVPRMTGLVYMGLSGIAAGATVLYFRRHPRSYWSAYQGDVGTVRAGYALLGMLSYGLLPFLFSFV
ncbi:hypothetical protein LRS06_22245 [Hymenobacter sp. J193]|uniref:hypothetical protein n=1 Tax=Hymenobacter sp. J193 TaxID=2898429 RepID=UPI0021512BB4|nr:hypothetical protein [Hymenobacter sp. J193]MCR5890295.1 hypothetical protein [Hymenobacter sp. J193]MCR5890452.1 hypothetical protein [Hymenobacter sp. J193]